MNWPGFSKQLVFIGITLIVIGFFWALTHKFLPLGKLPGDIRIKRDGFAFYFPLTTCILISGLLSLFSYLWKTFFKG